MDTRYTVRQAMEKVGVKAYVLRYWEDELDLKIHRNEMGHRYYTGYDIQLLMNIKELKSRGLQLRAIKDLIPKMKLRRDENEREEKNVFALTEFQSDTKEVHDIEKTDVQEEKFLEFQMILERLIAQELQAKNEEEEKCRSLDLAIRKQQLARREAAAAGQKKRSDRKKIHNFSC